MVYILLAPGFEEMEALVPADLLRRAGIEVALVSLEGEFVPGGHNIIVKADMELSQVRMDDLELLMLPGGGVGTDNLSAHEPLRAALKEANAKGILIAAICAAPMVLGRSGLIEGRKATCYPGCESNLFGAEYTSASVEECGNIITACGLGVSFDFGFAIVARLCEEGTVATLRSQMQFK